MGTKRREREDEEPRRHSSSRSSYHGEYCDRHGLSRYEDRHYHSSSGRHSDERLYSSSSRRGDERHYDNSRHRSRHSSSSKDEGPYGERRRREYEDRRSREEERRRAGDVEDGTSRRSSGIVGDESRNVVDCSVKTDGGADLQSQERELQRTNQESPKQRRAEIEMQQQEIIDEENQRRDSANKQDEDPANKEENPANQQPASQQEENSVDQQQEISADEQQNSGDHDCVQQQQSDDLAQQKSLENQLDGQPQRQQSGDETPEQNSAERADVEMEQQDEEQQGEQQQQLNFEETSTSGSKQDRDPEEAGQATGEGQPPTPEVQDVKVSPPSGACRIVDEYEKIGRLGEGAYGVVYKARDKRNGDVVAVKKIKMYNENTEGFPVTSLREINLLMSLSHPSIITVKEVVVNKEMDSVFMVMEYIETTLKDVMAKLKQPLDFGTVKWMLLQLLSSIAYLHDKWVLHRDVKPSNILLSREGELKLCDFGLARRYDSPIKPYTHNVVTMWYRAPELLSKGPVAYSTAIDIWSVGCIMGELLLNQPLFQGTSEVDQLKRICRVIPKVQNPGFLFQTQNRLRERILPPAAAAGRPMLSEKGFDLLSRLLAFDPNKRISAKEAMNHAWFQEEPLPWRFSAAIFDEDGEDGDKNHNVGGE